MVDELLQENTSYTRSLEKRLKNRILEDVFPRFAQGFIEYLKAQEDTVDTRQGASLPVVIQPDHLSEHGEVLCQQVFQGTLTFLYRLLFLLHAESRGILPANGAGGYSHLSLTCLKQEVAHKAGTSWAQRQDRLRKAYGASSRDTDLYDRLLGSFANVDRGSRDLNLQVYNGGLFLTEPEPDDQTPQAHNSRFLLSYKIPDLYLAWGLDCLARDIDEMQLDLAFIDYKLLDVRQLGSIYEMLLGLKLRIAREEMAVIRSKKAEEVIPHREAVNTGQKILVNGRGQGAVERFYRPGEAYLENDRRERKAIGSFYTPEYIVKYIVEHAVGPVLEQKIKKLRPRLLEAQEAHCRAFQQREAFGNSVQKPDYPAEAPNTYVQLVDELLDFRVLDPSMGCGLFLVEAVDFICDRILAQTNELVKGFTWNPVTAFLNDTRQQILGDAERQGIALDASGLTDVDLLKRHILKRCIFGVDMNPMAVELSKVTLWLHCFIPGASSPFLDHHLKHGNSLIGTTLQAMDRELAVTYGELQKRSGGRPGICLLTAVRHLSPCGRAATNETDEPHHLGNCCPPGAGRGFRLFCNTLNTTELAARNSDRVSLLFGDSLDGAPSMAARIPELSRLPDATVEQAQRSQSAFAEYERAKAPFKTLLDVWVSRCFGNTLAAEYFSIERRDPVHEVRSDRLGLPPARRAAIEKANAISREKCFFHWDIEFPEAFMDLVRGTWKPGEEQGFDAMVGNPPYISSYSRHSQKSVIGADSYFGRLLAGQIGGRINTFLLFLVNSIKYLRDGGCCGLILPDTFIHNESYAATRRFLARNFHVSSLLKCTFPVFEDSTVGSAIPIVFKSSPAEIRVVEARNAREVERKRFQVDSKVEVQAVLESPSARFPFVGTHDLEFLHQVERHSVSLGTLCHVRDGVNPGTREFRNAIINPSGPPKPTYRNLIEGENVKRYWISPAVKIIDYDPRLLTPDFKKQGASFRQAWIFDPGKIATRQTAGRLIAAFDASDAVALNSVHLTRVKEDCHYSVWFILACLNSEILSKYYRLRFQETRATFPQVHVSTLRLLPIPRIATSRQILGAETPSLLPPFVRWELSGTLDIESLATGVAHLPADTRRLIYHDVIAHLAKCICEHDNSGGRALENSIELLLAHLYGYASPRLNSATTVPATISAPPRTPDGSSVSPRRSSIGSRPADTTGRLERRRTPWSRSGSAGRRRRPHE